MKIRWAVLVFAAAFFLQTTVFGMFPVFGVSANLILCSAVMISFVFDDDHSALIVGAFTGLLYDICFGQYMGLTAFALILIVLLCVLLKTFLLNNENFLSAVVVSAVSVFVYYNIYWILVKIAGFRTGYLYMLEKMPVYILLNGIIMLIMFFVMSAITDKHRADRYTRWEK